MHGSHHPHGSYYDHHDMHRSDAYHGHRYKNFSKSSIFVPSEWEVKNTKSGFSNLITNVFRAIDKRFHPHDSHAYHGYPRYNHHSHGHYGHHGHHRHHNLSHSYYSQPSTVLISDDMHGMFSHSRLYTPFHRGYAHVSSKSVPTECPRCKKQIMTLVKQTPGAPHLIATVGAVAL
ncbi:hypothetical protein H4R99_007480, partial [Coemansia sp. RSA 1722]